MCEREREAKRAKTRVLPCCRAVCFAGWMSDGLLGSARQRWVCVVRMLISYW